MLNLVTRSKPQIFLPCFYCGLDSNELKIFLITVIGSLCLGSVFVGLGSLLRGLFKNPEEIKDKVFEAEERE